MLGIMGGHVRAAHDSQEGIQDKRHQRGDRQGNRLTDPPNGHQHGDGGHFLAFRGHTRRSRHHQHQDEQPQTAQ